MNLDPRIIEGKRVLTPFDIEEAEQFNGLSGYFSNVTDDFRHLENAAHGVLDLTFGDYPYRYRNDEGEVSTGGCLYFLPDAWVMKELNREIVLKRCHEIKGDLAVLCGKQNQLLKCICNHRCGYDEPGDKSMVWHMRDILMDAYTMYKECLEDFEKGNY
jgi:hypothetical protein